MICLDERENKDLEWKIICEVFLIVRQRFGIGVDDFDDRFGLDDEWGMVTFMSCHAGGDRNYWLKFYPDPDQDGAWVGEAEEFWGGSAYAANQDLGRLQLDLGLAPNEQDLQRIADAIVNPVKQVSVPSAEDAVRDHVVTEAEEKAYFATALSKFELVKDGKSEKRGPFPALHDAARIILDQGMRPDEVLSLRVEHVDFNKGKLRIIRGKSKAARRVLDMSAAVKSILAKRAQGRTEGWIFEGNKPGTHLTKLNNAHDAVVQKVGSEFVLYEFRHTFATRFGEAVGDPIALAAILGHTNLKTVMKYCHTRESHTAKAMQTYFGATAAQPVAVKIQSAGKVN